LEVIRKHILPPGGGDTTGLIANIPLVSHLP
jgi:hypothetical protein